MGRIGRIAAIVWLSWCPAAGALTVEFRGVVGGGSGPYVPQEMLGLVSDGAVLLGAARHARAAKREM